MNEFSDLLKLKLQMSIIKLYYEHGYISEFRYQNASNLIYKKIREMDIKEKGERSILKVTL